MKRALYNILTFEKAGRGLQSWNLAEEYYGYRVSEAFYMFTVSFSATLLLGLYLGNVLRLGEREAMKLPWYYPLSSLYWLG
jgi:hypothetical protein